MVPSGAIKDLAGNNFSGTTTYDFTTVDTTSPTVITFNPADGSTTAPVGTNIVLTFSEPIQRGSGQIELKTYSYGYLGPIEAFNAATSARITITGSTFTLDPASTLVAGQQYFLSIPSGAIKDLSGNNYAGTATYDFTPSAIADTTAPTISISSDKTSLGVGETALITFTLNESSTDFTAADVTVSGGTLSNFSGSGTNYSATFTPAINSTTNAFISVASNRFSDAAGNFNTDGADANNSVSLNVNTVAQVVAPPSTTLPLAPVITSASDNFSPGIGVVSAGAVTNDTTPTFTITAAAGSTVRVFDNGSLLGRAT